MVHENVAGVSSVIPPAMARTAKTCAPSARAGYVMGDVQGMKAGGVPSAHSNVALAVLLENVNVAFAWFVGSAGGRARRGWTGGGGAGRAAARGAAPAARRRWGRRAAGRRGAAGPPRRAPEPTHPGSRPPRRPVVTLPRRLAPRRPRPRHRVARTQRRRRSQHRVRL